MCGGGGGNCSMSFRLDIFGDYTMENFKTCLNTYQKTLGAVLFCIIFHAFNHRVTSYSQAISVTSTV